MTTRAIHLFLGTVAAALFGVAAHSVFVQAASPTGRGLTLAGAFAGVMLVGVLSRLAAEKLAGRQRCLADSESANSTSADTSWVPLDSDFAEDLSSFFAPHFNFMIEDVDMESTAFTVDRTTLVTEELHSLEGDAGPAVAPERMPTNGRPVVYREIGALAAASVIAILSIGSPGSIRAPRDAASFRVVGGDSCC